jgi:butyryl-CoA dehydrogenase
MNFEFLQETRDAVLKFRELVQKEIAPHAQELDSATDDFKDKTIKASIVKLGAAGFLRSPFMADAGGLGQAWLDWTLSAEEVARACPSTFLSAVSGSLVSCVAPAKFGSSAQKTRWVMPCLAGEIIGAFALTEPEGGANPAAINAVAEKTRDGWVLNGVKTYVTNGPVCDFAVVAARTSPNGPGGVSLFIVPADAEGFKRGGRADLMGHRGAAVGDIVLTNCRLGEDALIGKENEGFGYAMHALQIARLAAAVGSLGIGDACLEHSLEYARGRVSFGGKIIKHQEVSFKLAQMRLQTDVARLQIQFAAWSMDIHDPDEAAAVSCAKVYATESAAKLAHMAVQIFGGKGYTRGSVAERLYRDARLGEILHGPSEIQRVMLARDALDKVGA